jgi:hypothetical protein
MELSRTRERILSFLPPDQGRLERVSRLFRDDQLFNRSQIIDEFETDRVTLTTERLMTKYWMYRELHHILIHINRELLFLEGIKSGVFMENVYLEEYKNDGLTTAAKYGHLDLVKLLSSGVISIEQLNDALYNAARGGHLPIVEYLIDRGATDLDRALCAAASGGHLPVVKYLIDRGATDLDRALHTAAFGGHLPVVEYLIGRGGVDTDQLNNALECAAGEGYLSVVEYLKTEVLIRSK